MPNKVLDSKSADSIVTEIEKMDFSDEFVSAWPVQLQSGTIEKITDGSGIDTYSATIEVTNIQRRTIKYMEWNLECFDILKISLDCEVPVLIRLEKSIESGKSVIAAIYGIPLERVSVAFGKGIRTR